MTKRVKAPSAPLPPKVETNLRECAYIEMQGDVEFRLDIASPNALSDVQETIRQWGRLKTPNTTFVAVSHKGERATVSFRRLREAFQVTAPKEEAPVHVHPWATVARVHCTLGTYSARMPVSQGTDSEKACRKVVTAWRGPAFKGATWFVVSRAGDHNRVTLNELCRMFDVTPCAREDADILAGGPFLQTAPAPVALPPGIPEGAIPLSSMAPIACQGAPLACGCDKHVAARDAARRDVVATAPMPRARRKASEVVAELQAAGVPVKLATTPDAPAIAPAPVAVAAVPQTIEGTAPATSKRLKIEIVDVDPTAPAPKVAPKFFTIGYDGGLTPNRVREIMDARGIKLLIDTRNRDTRGEWSFARATESIGGAKYRAARNEREIVALIAKLEKETGASALFLRKEEAPGDSDLHLAMAKVIDVVHLFRDEEVTGAELQAAIDKDAAEPTLAPGGHPYQAELMAPEIARYHVPPATVASASAAA